MKLFAQIAQAEAYEVVNVDVCLPLFNWKQTCINLNLQNHTHEKIE